MPKNNKTSMNIELQRWIEDSKDEIKTTQSKKNKCKKPTGKCQICGEKTAESVCIKCDKAVCKSCYFKLISVCKKCIPPEIAGKWDGSQPDWEKELGVEWVG